MAVLTRSECNGQTHPDTREVEVNQDSSKGAGKLALLNKDQEFWWNATASSLGTLMKNAEYSDEDQLKHLRWYRELILPALGPRPAKAVFKPCPVFDGSAVEHSLNWKENQQKRTVRFTIEANSYEAGTSKDLFNQRAAEKLVRRLAAASSVFDTRQFDIFADALFIPDERAAKLDETVTAEMPRSQVWLAFDLLKGEALTKVYFMPVLKWHETNIPTKTLVFDAVRKCNRPGESYDKAVSVLDDYLKSFEAGQGPVIEMVAIDCVDSPSSRIKIYLRTGVNTLRKAKSQFTLNGRLSGKSVEKGLEALTELWPILFRLNAVSTENLEDVEVLPVGSYCGCAIELRPGVAELETKLHIPIWKAATIDAQICQSLSTFFNQRGHVDFAANYQSQLSTAFPDHELNDSNGTHTFISFTYTQQTGCYMTMYYSTKTVGSHAEKTNIWKGYDSMWKSSGEHHGCSKSLEPPTRRVS